MFLISPENYGVSDRLLVPLLRFALHAEKGCLIKPVVPDLAGRDNGTVYRMFLIIDTYYKRNLTIY